MVAGLAWCCKKRHALVDAGLAAWRGDMIDVGPSLVGIGLYTPAEAGRLINVAPAKLSRWLCGHMAQGAWYDPLWKPQIDLGDAKTYLSFRDLLEARIASLFIKKGLSPQKVRSAIKLAGEVVGDRPLSTTWLRTDGRSVFLKVLQEDGGEPKIIDLFKKQYAFSAVVEPSLKDVEFEGVVPKVWWPRGRKLGVLVDPLRAFGQPIERETSIPAEVLANAAAGAGSPEGAARAWRVPVQAVRRAVRFQQELGHKQAA